MLDVTSRCPSALVHTAMFRSYNLKRQVIQLQIQRNYCTALSVFSNILAKSTCAVVLPWYVHCAIVRDSKWLFLSGRECNKASSAATDFVQSCQDGTKSSMFSGIMFNNSDIKRNKWPTFNVVIPYNPRNSTHWTSFVPTILWWAQVGQPPVSTITCVCKHTVHTSNRITQSVWLATDWTVRGSKPGDEDQVSRNHPDRSRGPSNSLYNVYRVYLPGVRWPDHGANHSPPSSTGLCVGSDICLPPISACLACNGAG
jgi:hypothetical protein